MINLVLPDIPAEDRLLEQARRGNQEAISQIYESYFAPIYQFIRLRVDDAALAEDLAAEVFVKFIGALRGRNAPRQTLRGWLFRVARHVLHDHYAKAGQFATATLEEWLPAPSLDDPEAQLIRALDRDQIRRAIRMLTAEQQEVLILRFGQRLSLQETADIMGKRVNAVKSLQFRAVDHLRQTLNRAASGANYG